MNPQAPLPLCPCWFSLPSEQHNVALFCPFVQKHISPLLSSWLPPSREATLVSQTLWLQLPHLLPPREEPWLGHCKVLPHLMSPHSQWAEGASKPCLTKGWTPLADSRRIQVIVPHPPTFLVRIFLKSLGTGSRLPGWPKQLPGAGSV